MHLLVLTYWEIHSIRDCLSVKSMENQLLPLALIFPTRVSYLPLVFSYLLFQQQHPSRQQEWGRTTLLLGQQFSVLWSDYLGFVFISTACVYQHTQSVLQAPLGWGRHQQNNQQCQQHWCHYSHGLQMFPGQTIVNCKALATAPGCSHTCGQWGSQDDEYCTNTAHSSHFTLNERLRKGCHFWRKLHISEVPVIISQTEDFPPQV